MGRVERHESREALASELGHMRAITFLAILRDGLSLVIRVQGYFIGA